MRKKYNVIMILLDGARIDMFEGFKALQNLKKRGTFFSQPIVSSPYTIASVHSIFTGMPGSENGVDSYYHMFGLKESVKTLQEYYKENNFYTEGTIMNEAVLTSKGFDNLTVHDEHSVDMLSHHKSIIEGALNQAKPYFLFLQYSKIHTDSVNNVAKKFDDLDEEYYTNSQRKINEKLYRKSMEEASYYVDSISDFMSEKKILEDTIVVFFSDHGTSIGEKLGEKMYGSFTYDYTIRSFISFINDDLFPKRDIPYQVRTIDIMPTLLEANHISPSRSSKKMSGQSLFSYIRPTSSFWNFFTSKLECEDRIAYVETGGLKGLWPSPKASNVKCLRTPSHKIIHNLTPDTWEFYDLISDPDEIINLIDSDSSVKNQMIEKLKELELSHDNAN